VLANVYLHYVLDLWFEKRFKKSCRKWTELTRYADDFLAAFQDRADAERFRREMEERLAAFELHVAPEKTAVLRFDGSLLHGTGRPKIKPATFTFLGFKHFLTKTRRGTINIGRTASIKARERFLRRQADWLRANRHLDVHKQQAHLRLALNGYYQYFGVRLAEQALYSVYRRIRKLWRKQLRRRSERARRTCAWSDLYAKAWFQLPRPRITQAWV
jgi:RNA-directed DNA polymerase